MKYKQSFDCIDDIEPLYSREINVKEKMDKDIENIRSFLSVLNRSGVTESAARVQNVLTLTKEVRDIYVNRLAEKIKNTSKKYYNEIEIK